MTMNDENESVTHKMDSQQTAWPTSLSSVCISMHFWFSTVSYVLFCQKPALLFSYRQLASQRFVAKNISILYKCNRTLDLFVDEVFQLYQTRFLYLVFLSITFFFSIQRFSYISVFYIPLDYYGVSLSLHFFFSYF